ncbi:Zinc finger protein [Entamoeba marina]
MNNQLSDESLEEIQSFQQIYPDELKQIQVNEFVLTVTLPPSPIEFFIHPLSSGIPQRYRNKKKVIIENLPPISVYVVFVNSIPTFRITSIWMTNEKIVDITREVELLIEQNALIEQEISSIDISIFPTSPVSQSSRQITIIQYDYDESIREFNSRTEVTCDVCYNDLPPSEFTILSACGHYICNECLRENVEVCLSNATFAECPYSCCKAEILPWEMKRSCGKELIEKYENQLVLLYVQKEGDSVVCPFCNYSRILVDPIVHKVATPINCPFCEKTFCSICFLKNHVGDCYVDQVLDQYKTRRYYDYILGQLLEKSLRHCPVCKLPIVKSYGCNKMTCICGNSFCYKCGKRINGYDHFRSGNCELFTAESLMEDNSVNKISTELTDLLDELMKSETHFPFYCEYCKKILKCRLDKLIIICPTCKHRKCRHCGEYDIDKTHVLNVSQIARFAHLKIPKNMDTWT